MRQHRGACAVVAFCYFRVRDNRIPGSIVREFLDLSKVRNGFRAVVHCGRDVRHFTLKVGGALYRVLEKFCGLVAKTELGQAATERFDLTPEIAESARNRVELGK